MPDRVLGGPAGLGMRQRERGSPGKAGPSWQVPSSCRLTLACCCRCNKYLKVVPPSKTGPVRWLGRDTAVCRVPEGFHLGGQDLGDDLLLLPSGLPPAGVFVLGQVGSQGFTWSLRGQTPWAPRMATSALARAAA